MDRSFALAPGAPDYSWDAERHLFRRDPPTSFPYSDGIAFEQRLLSLMRSVTDRSVLSPQLHQGITDWPSEYHLSRLRHCLIRPLNIKSGERVLEVGAGCGAITRYLGELGARVTALEGSLSRATITSERCRDLPNVTVISDDLLRFDTANNYDWILLIGVLEYAPVFSPSAAPVQHYLNHLNRFLAPDGTLVVAIENKLGLKYFNACGEDHLGVPFFGIQNLYDVRTPRTFGRSELITELSSAGFPFTRFYYPFPDYKLPTVILSDEALRSDTFDSVDLLLRSRSRDYTGRNVRIFNEPLVFSSLARNGLLADFANSFLILANHRPVPDGSGELATTYAVGRRPQFSTTTRFFRDGLTIRVKKEFLQPGGSRQGVTHGGMKFRIIDIATKYVQGRQLFFRFLTEQARQAPLETLLAVLQPWLQFLLQHAKPNQLEAPRAAPTELSTLSIDGSFLDCTPYNLLERGRELVHIDQEWSTETDVPLGWVLTRGLKYCFTEGISSSDGAASLTDILPALIRTAGLVTPEADILKWLADEVAFQKAVTGYDSPTSDNLSSDATPVTRYIIDLNALVARRDAERVQSRAREREYETRLTSVQQALELERSIGHRALSERDSLTAELGLVKRSLSWRLTRPLRFLKHRLRRVLRTQDS
jgi:SAM-dependent methyltransferase